jgi:hypothetical protein
MTRALGTTGPGGAVIAANVVGYYVAWVVAILGAAWTFPWAGPLLALPLLALHLKLAREVGPELRLMLVAAAMGVAGDGLLMLADRISFTSGVIVPGLPPPWMIGLWMLFATMFNVSLRWLRPRKLLGALLGALGAPLAYWAGARMGAAVLGPPVELSLLAIALLWAVATPLLLALAERQDGFSPR